ncbi:MAG: MotA/TolQ/ExbB proton channel family protein [Deltaproteobacteria bacterium]
MLDGFADIRDLLEVGGPVVTVIMLVTLAMWTMIVERLWYFRRLHPLEIEGVMAAWKSRADKGSWSSHQIRRKMISEVRAGLERSLPLVRALVALCPLLGLLGTVTGMIEVFDVMAIAGSGNPRAMAAGVSRATIPTMAGMVAALSGLVVSMRMDRWAAAESERLADALTGA